MVSSMKDREKAQANRTYVRRLLREKQPGFAAALESVVLEWWPGRGGATTPEMPGECRDPDGRDGRLAPIT
jgi:hypothetical protein